MCLLATLEDDNNNCHSAIKLSEYMCIGSAVH